MSLPKLFFVLVVGIVFGQTDAQCIGRIRTVVPAYPQQSLVPAYPQPTVVTAYPQSAAVSSYPQGPYSTSGKNEDLGSIAALLAQLLNEKEEKYTESNQSANCPVYASGNLNVEDIIMKLVNALIYTTTQTGGKSTSATSSTGASGSGNLIDLDLLGKGGNLLGLGLGGQGVLGVGVGQ